MKFARCRYRRRAALPAQAGGRALTPRIPNAAIDRTNHAAGTAVRRLRTNLGSALRLCLPWPVRDCRIDATLGQLIWLVALLWLVAALDDVAAAGLPAEFSVWGFVAFAAAGYVWLAGLAFVVLLGRGIHGYLGLAVAMAGVLVWQLLAWSLLAHGATAFAAAAYERYYAVIWTTFVAWEIAVFARVVVRVYGARLRTTVAYAALYGGIVYATLTVLPHTPMFVEPWAPATERRPDVEATYYAQPNLLAQSLYALAPQRPGVADVYFIGVAAYADQDVFRREIEQATAIVEERFDAAGRTINLVNHTDTLNTVPLANRHNLDRVVRGLAERIDPQEDVVVVFLSSHGDDDATIAVDLGGFGMNDIAAADVREILERHGIGWRIVIVSACYSGSFIDALASPRTLVMTAAAKDRASFGCSHENEWTYFGEAYFAKALTQTNSFVDAFDIARERIGERESAEGKTASLPQRSLGADIARHLAAHGL